MPIEYSARGLHIASTHRLHIGEVRAPHEAVGPINPDKFVEAALHTQSRMGLSDLWVPQQSHETAS